MAGIRRVSDLGTQGVKTILDGSVQTADIANNAITSAKIADSTIDTADIANSAITSTKIANNTITIDNLATATRPALTLVTSGDFSSSSPITLSNCFTATYDDYICNFYIIGTQDAFFFKMASNGTPTSTSSYDRTRIYGQSTMAVQRSTLQTSSILGYIGANESAYSVRFHSPKLNKYTIVYSEGVYSDNTNLGFIELNTTWVRLTTEFDGFQFGPASGTMTGRYEIYGMRS